MLNKLEIYNKVKNHLLSQGCKSVMEGDVTCLYRGPNGTKCAVGILIPDELYDKDMEGKGITQAMREDTSLWHAITRLGVECEEDILFLSSLQFIHDCCEVEDWPLKLENFANNME